MIVADAEGLGDFETQWGPFMQAESAGEEFVGRARVKLPSSVLAPARLPKMRTGRATMPVLPGAIGKKFAAAMPKSRVLKLGLPKPAAAEMKTSAVVATAVVPSAPGGLAALWQKVKTQPAYTVGAVLAGIVLLKVMTK